MQNLVPHFILNKHAAGEQQGRFPAASLFVDISGFSAVTNALVEEILPYLDQGGSFGGAERPLRNHLICYQVLQAAGDSRASGVLQAAHQALQEQVARIPDEPTRRSFLEKVPWHWEIMAEIQRREQEKQVPLEETVAVEDGRGAPEPVAAALAQKRPRKKKRKVVRAKESQT